MKANAKVVDASFDSDDKANLDPRTIIVSVVSIAIAIALIPTIVDFTDSADTNLTEYSGAQSLVKLMPLLFVGVVVLAGVGAYIHQGRK